MGMHLAMTRVNHQPLKIRLNDQRIKQFLPNLSITPTTKSPMRILPVTIVAWQIPPWRACTQYPEHGIDKSTVVMCNAAPLTALAWK